MLSFCVGRINEIINLKTNKMTTEEFKELEKLLGKVQTKLGNRFAIIPDHLNGGCHIATYNNVGIMEKQLQGATIESVVCELAKQNRA